MAYKDPQKYRAWRREYVKRPDIRARMNAYANKRYKMGLNRRSPEQERARNLQRSYGITIEVFRHMEQIQNGCCAICRQKPVGKRHLGKLFVDHDHTTGKIRGLLCHCCNVMIGYAKNNPGTLRIAAEYLESCRG